MSPQLRTAPSLDDRHFITNIRSDLQNIYGELTHEPCNGREDERPRLFGGCLTSRTEEQLRALVVAMNRAFSSPPQAKNARTGASAKWKRFCLLQDVIEGVDRSLARRIEEIELCHIETEACSRDCGDTAELYARILYFRSSLLRVYALTEMLKARALRRVKKPAGLRPSRPH